MKVQLRKKELESLEVKIESEEKRQLGEAAVWERTLSSCAVEAAQVHQSREAMITTKREIMNANFNPAD